MDSEKRKYVRDAELLLNEFKNPEKLLQENAVFAKIFYSLCHGMSPYQAIEELTTMLDSYQEEIKKLASNQRNPVLVVEPTEENLNLIFKEAFFSDSNYPDW